MHLVYHLFMANTLHIADCQRAALERPPNRPPYIHNHNPAILELCFTQARVQFEQLGIMKGRHPSFDGVLTTGKVRYYPLIDDRQKIICYWKSAVM
jgi:hypothetical protein